MNRGCSAAGEMTSDFSFMSRWLKEQRLKTQSRRTRPAAGFRAVGDGCWPWSVLSMLFARAVAVAAEFEPAVPRVKVEKFAEAGMSWRSLRASRVEEKTVELKVL